jgi:hypothetical protein
MTTPLIAPLIPRRPRPGVREHGQAALARRLPLATAPEVPAVPDDVVSAERPIRDTPTPSPPQRPKPSARPGAAHRRASFDEIEPSTPTTIFGRTSSP